MKTTLIRKALAPWPTMVLFGLLTLAAGCRSTGATIPTAIPLTDIEWQWIASVEKESGERFSVPDPEKYTLVFKTDGMYHGKADCNLISGSYAQEDGFKIVPGPATMAYCGEQSLDQKFLGQLGQAVAGGLDDQGRLALESAGGATQMIFHNGGKAP